MEQLRKGSANLQQDESSKDPEAEFAGTSERIRISDVLGKNSGKLRFKTH